MPELPDIEAYVEALRERLLGERLESVSLRSPFVLRTVEPPYRVLEGRSVVDVRRLAKRIVFGFEGEHFLVMHLMRLGRLRWAPPQTKAKHAGGKVLLASFVFSSGTLYLVEMGPKKRAAIHVVVGEDAVAAMHPGGLELFESSLEEFAEVLTLRNHTLKRALCDQRLLAGIGNAYSDEILWEARLSPVKQTHKLSEDEMRGLYEASHRCLARWIQNLRDQRADGFPEKVTAFQEGMAVHGRYGKPCPRCGVNVQRIVYADRETNYCPGCQTGGRPLADRGLSRLLKRDWPKTMEELESLRSGGRASGSS